ncbi:unnamed protein product [Adineta steineri]|uniref:RRM domain-containing protein n=1 Tax=Adineta steineri TaxID=433720 RepID=A0A819JIZ9_9BILA|nr:unnamed protein product [Adineta steineri]
MASNPNTALYQNLSLCVYIGNTTTIENDTLFDYCSQFGTVVTHSFNKEKFCDFHIIEFADLKSLESFLKTNDHKINAIKLDIKFYKNILTNNDALNIERKFFVGPILHKNDITQIMLFYKKQDSTVYYQLSKQNEQEYLLLQFANRQTVSMILEQQKIPILNEHRKCHIYKPTHPKQFVNKIISMKNKHNQIHIHGLTNNITDIMLIDYFHKRVPVIACHILLNNPKCAVMEFNDEKTVRKILETSNIYLQGINLVLSKASRSLASLLSSSTDDSDDENIKTTVISQPILSSLQTQNLAPVPTTQVMSQDIIQQLLLAMFNPIQPVNRIEPEYISPPEINESGWMSPPRTIVSDYPTIEPVPVRLPSHPRATTMSISMDPEYRPETSDVDIKPFNKVPSNNILQFVEQFDNELDQIKNEYLSKFSKDRTTIEREINQLINEERQTLNRLDRYLNDRRKRVEKRHNKKRRHSSPSSSD